MEYTSINKLFESSFRDNWDREALSNYQGITLHYSEVAKRIEFLHREFRSHGIALGDKVAICGRNQVNWGVCFLAAMTYGAVPVPILHEFKPDNIHYLVNHSDASVFCVDDSIWENLSESEIPEVRLLVKMSTIGSADNFCREDLSYHIDKPDDLAIINYTSGTSGFSKGVMLPYKSVLLNIRFAKCTAEPQMNQTSKLVSMLPSAHMYGLMFEFIYIMVVGGHTYFLNRVPSPKVILSAFADIKPDLIISVPLVIEKVYKSRIKPIVDRNGMYMKLPIINQFALKKIREAMIEAFGGQFEEVIIGGAAFNPEVEDFMIRTKFPFTVGYGMTECGPIITYSKWSKSRKGSCGVAVPGCSIRIDSKNPARIPGEIQVKGDNVFLGYYKNKDATKAVFTNDNWFKTGDIGTIDSDGFLYIRGRSKCMILGPSGQNIYPEEMEAVINNLTYVVESLVIEDNGGLSALIYPDYHQGELDGLSREYLEKRIAENLPELNKRFPSYAQVRKIEFMPEDFERTPKRSIKRYLYQRNND